MHTAKELHDEQCFREWLAHWRDHAANAPVVNGYWQRIERALSLLASVEDEDGIVRELRDLYKWCSPQYGDPMKKAAALSNVPAPDSALVVGCYRPPYPSSLFLADLSATIQVDSVRERTSVCQDTQESA